MHGGVLYMAVIHKQVFHTMHQEVSKHTAPRSNLQLLVVRPSMHCFTCDSTAPQHSVAACKPQFMQLTPCSLID
jgi:hypothetical protein